MVDSYSRVKLKIRQYMYKMRISLKTFFSRIQEEVILELMILKTYLTLRMKRRKAWGPPLLQRVRRENIQTLWCLKFRVFTMHV